MNGDDSFHVTLVSDDSMEYHEDNSATSFGNKLYKRVNLNEDWEVALLELHVPVTMSNFYHNNSSVWVSIHGNITLHYILPEIYYSDVNKLLDKLNTAMLKSYIFSLENGHVICTPSNLEEPMGIKFSETLALQLGFVPVQDFQSGILKANEDPNLDAGLPNLIYVYTNVVQPQFVGSSAHRLLRVVSLNTSHLHRGSTVCLSVQHPQYLPVATKVLDHIEINIKDASGIALPFQCGRSSVVLHFKHKHA